MRASHALRWSVRPRPTESNARPGGSRWRPVACRRRSGDAGRQAGSRAGGRHGPRAGPCAWPCALHAVGRGGWARRSATAAPRRGLFCLRGPGPFGLGVQVVAHQLLATRRGQGPLRRLGQPDLHLALTGKAVWGLELCLPRRSGGRGETLVAREKAWRRCRFWRSRALFMRRGNASARSVIRGMAGRLSVCLCLLVGRERSRAEICIAANRKPYKPIL